jgi:hypothetical protein
MRKCQVSVPPCFGRLAGLPTSSGVRIITVASLSRALASRSRCCVVSTSCELTSSPVPATIISLGTMTK